MDKKNDFNCIFGRWLNHPLALTIQCNKPGYLERQLYEEVLSRFWTSSLVPKNIFMYLGANVCPQAIEHWLRESIDISNCLYAGRR